MAPVDPLLANSNIRPISLAATYFTIVAGLLSLVGRNIYRSDKSLPPSQDTRWRQSNRQRNIRIFLLLAVVSFFQALYHIAATAVLSYRVWAYEMSVDLPSTPYGYHSIRELMLGRWLAMTSPLSHDAWEIVVGSSARFWWTQQVFLGSAAWALYVGVEGRRRQIPHLWAFVLLAPLVSRAFAINVFFLAVLATPVPQPPKRRAHSQAHSANQTGGLVRYAPSRFHAVFHKIRPFLPHNPLDDPPANWQPYGWAIKLQSSGIFLAMLLAPYTTGTTHLSLAIVVSLAVLFRLVYFARLGSLGFGSTNMTPHQISENYRSALRFIAICSFLLYLKQTFVALLDTDPGSHRHIHSDYLGTFRSPIQRHRSGLLRSSIAVGDLLGTIHDHPATSRLGYDVILSAVSLAIWSVARGSSLDNMFALFRRDQRQTSRKSASPTDGDVATPAKRTRARSRKSSAASSTAAAASSKVDESGDTSYRPATSKTKGAFSTASSWQGEEEYKDNGEAGALALLSGVLGGLGVLSSVVFCAEIV